MYVNEFDSERIVSVLCFNWCVLTIKQAAREDKDVDSGSVRWCRYIERIHLQQKNSGVIGRGIAIVIRRHCLLNFRTTHMIGHYCVVHSSHEQSDLPAQKT